MMFFRKNFGNGILVTLILLSCAILSGSATTGQTHGGTVSGQSAVDTVRAALAARTLWGRDYSVVLGSIPAWARIHEKTITIARDVIFGGTPFRTRHEAEAEAGVLAGALAEKALGILPQFVATADEGRKLAASHVSVRPYAGGESYRVVVGYGLNPLSENLAAADVVRIAGEPQTVKRGQDEGGEEDRPLGITDYVYAGGAALFETWAVANDRVVSATFDVQTSINAMGGTQ